MRLPEISGHCSLLLLAVSLTIPPAGVLQLWLHQAGDPEHYKDYAAFLGTVASHASSYLHLRKSAHARSLAASWKMPSPVSAASTAFLRMVNPPPSRPTRSNRPLI